MKLKISSLLQSSLLQNTLLVTFSTWPGLVSLSRRRTPQTESGSGTDTRNHFSKRLHGLWRLVGSFWCLWPTWDSVVGEAWWLGLYILEAKYRCCVFIVRSSVPHWSTAMSGAYKRFPLEVKFEILPETLGGQFRKDFPPYLDGLVKCTPGSYVTTPEYAKRAEDIYNFVPRPDDIYVSTFPKCGKAQTKQIYKSK